MRSGPGARAPGLGSGARCRETCPHCPAAGPASNNRLSPLRGEHCTSSWVLAVAADLIVARIPLEQTKAGSHPPAQGSPPSVRSHQGAGSYTVITGQGGREKSLFCATWTLRNGCRHHKLCILFSVSRELDVLLGKWMCVCLSWKLTSRNPHSFATDLPKNCQVFAV